MLDIREVLIGIDDILLLLGAGHALMLMERPFLVVVLSVIAGSY